MRWRMLKGERLEVGDWRAPMPRRTLSREVAGVGGSRLAVGRSPTNPGGFRPRRWGITPQFPGVSRATWGFFGMQLGDLRGPLGEFRRPTWGIYGADLGDLPGPTGEFTRPPWGIYEAHLGVLRDPPGEFTGPTYGVYGAQPGNLRGPSGEFTGRTWGIYETHLGVLRDPPGEFTRPTWGIYEAHLGNSRGPLGEFTRPPWGIHEAALGLLTSTWEPREPRNCWRSRTLKSGRLLAQGRGSRSHGPRYRSRRRTECAHRPPGH